MSRNILGFVLTILITLISFALFQPNFHAYADEFDHSYSVYDSLLKKYVHNDGKCVDYKGIIESKEKFNSYLKQLGSVSQGDLEGWSREEKLAFWINAYNAFTLKAIIDHYPIDGGGISGFIYPKNSIRQIDGVWDKLKFQAAGRAVTLGEIEHEILRKKFDEPRIHAAINCASVGCPDLRPEAYRADKINEQLESASIGYVNSPEKGARIDPEDGNVKLSKIFNWFGGDFVSKYGSTDLFSGRGKEEKAVLNFVRAHLKSEKEIELLEGNKFDLSYLDYDWNLNECEDSKSS